MNELRIAYIVSDLKRVGPSNQTLNIIKNSKYKKNSMVITLFDESKDDTMIDEYKRNNIKVLCLHLNRITFILTGQRKLVKVLDENKINLIHSYGVKPDCMCVKVCKKINIKHIITLRNYPKEDILTRMNFIKGRIALKNHLKALLKCKHVICCSKTIYEKMSNDYPQKKFSYIQNGVDVDKYKSINEYEKRELRNKYGFDKDKTIYISTGSFIQRKRIEETIKGFIESKSNDVLLLLGDGVLYKELKEKYKDYSNIIFYGKTSNVEEFLQFSDYFISSSESEGLPNGVIEAIACGLPVILSDIPQHLEILEELKGAGVSYNLGNIEELSNIIANKVELNSDIDIDINITYSPFVMKNMSQQYVNYYTKVEEEKNK